MSGRRRYTGLIDRVAWVGLTLAPMHRQLMEAQLRCFPLHDEYLAIALALDGVQACAFGLIGEATPLRRSAPPTAYGAPGGTRP